MISLKVTGYNRIRLKLCAWKWQGRRIKLIYIHTGVYDALTGKKKYM